MCALNHSDARRDNMETIKRKKPHAYFFFDESGDSNIRRVRKLQFSEHEPQQIATASCAVVKPVRKLTEFPNRFILGHHGKNLLKEGKASKTFSVGFIKTQNPKKIAKDLQNLIEELKNDATLMAMDGVPSV